MLKYRSSALLCGGALICLLASPAFADSTSSNSTSSNPTTKVAAADTGIETIVVTAEKRAVNSQDLPVTLVAISGDDMDKSGVKDIASLGFEVPSLRFGPGVTGGENVITMRGLSSQNTTNGGDSPVAYSVDGVYLARSTTVDPDFFDINRVEVLLGPQGTLYGRNSVGGSINVITNKPTDDFSGHFDAMVGDYNARTFRGWANVPLYSCGECQIDFRVTAISANHDGYQKNVSTSPDATHDADGEDYTMLRGQLLFKFNADVSLLLAASQSQENDPVATKTQFWEAPGRFAGQTFYTNPWVIDDNTPETALNLNRTFAATFDWNLPWAKLESITASNKNVNYMTNDADGSGLDIGESQNWRVNTTQYSEELHLASNDDASPLDWIVGAFYFHEHSQMSFPFLDTGENDADTPIGYNPNVLGFFGPYTVQTGLGSAYYLNSYDDYKTTSFAFFGHFDYDLAKTSLDIPLTITGGARYNHDDKYGWDGLQYFVPDFAPFVGQSCPGYTFGVPFKGPFVPGTCGDIENSHQDFNQRFGEWTGEFKLSYKFTPDTMAYALVSKGYLSGGVLVTLYDPEQVWNYEVGMKTQWFDNRLQLNADVFHEKIEDQQVFIQIGPQSGITNAGAAHDDGLEAELTAVPVDGLRLNSTLSLQHAVFDNFVTENGRTSGTELSPTVVNWAGNSLIQTPKWTWDNGVEYAIDTSIGTFTPRVDVFWSAAVHYLAANDPLSTQPSYVLANFNLSYIEPKGRYTVDAFVHNIFNRAVISNDGLQSGSFAPTIPYNAGAGYEMDNYTYYPPRTIGVRFGVNF